MNNNLIIKILPAVLKTKGQAELTVTGTSMEPTLIEGDLITIIKCNNYTIGDILVFDYKNEGLLVHRLLKTSNRYFCKGDNSFRLEDMPAEKIIGKVTAVNGVPIAVWQKWKIDLSYAVNRSFVKSKYNITNTMQTDIYKLYSALILGKEENKMNYKKTDKMDFILSDETSLAVFDPESNNTYFFDETGIDILNCLDIPCNIEMLLDMLCNIYSASPEDIRADVEEFLADTVTKGIVEIV